LRATNICIVINPLREAARQCVHLGSGVLALMSIASFGTRNWKMTNAICSTSTFKDYLYTLEFTLILYYFERSLRCQRRLATISTMAEYTLNELTLLVWMVPCVQFRAYGRHAARVSPYKRCMSQVFVDTSSHLHQLNIAFVSFFCCLNCRSALFYMFNFI
ncbi:hypothetical protein L9F63_012540, partial [Diploptera punctata]